MKLAHLRELAKECKLNPHYQFRSLSPEEYMAKAAKSFSKLPDNQRTMVQKSWSEHIAKHGETFTEQSGAELLAYRFLAQTNLFFLCKLLEKYSQVTINTHEDICNDFFVQKDPTFLSVQHFANQYEPLKERMLLVPRNGFKSSVNIADCVQWIICYPAVTLLIITGVFDLAKSFVGELRGHFELENTLPDAKGKTSTQPRKLMDSETAEWTESLFQVLFPEHCIPVGEGKEAEFQTPAGGDDKEPTVRAASIEQALSGMHFSVLKLDDVVTNENVGTAERMEKVNRQIGVNRAMLNPGCFMDVVGTWYDTRDYYGVRIAQEIQFSEESDDPNGVKGSVESGRFETSMEIKTYLRAALWPKPEVAHKPEADLKKEDYELWFPERMTYEWLVKERKKDPLTFPIKYLNNPLKLDKVKFSRDLLLSRTIPHNQLPMSGTIVTTIDTAYSVKTGADYTVILTTLIAGGRFYVINMVRGRFNEHDLPNVIAATAYKWKPKRICIEDSMGVKWMVRELKREMDRLRITVPIEYVPLGQGSKKNSKLAKAQPVIRLLGDERMFFMNSCEGLDEIYTELTKFTGTNADAHDDIVSALSILADQFSAYADMTARTDQANLHYTTDRAEQERYDLVHGLGRYASMGIPEENPSSAFALEQAAQALAEAYSNFAESSDPLADLF